MKFETIHKGRYMPNTFGELPTSDKDVLLMCYKDAAGCDAHAVQAYDFFNKMPVSIKTDALTLGFENEAVQAKITNWLYNSYIDPILRK